MSFLDRKIHATWNNFITENIKSELDNISASINDYYPEDENVLRFMNNDLSSIKYIIVGMEPYCTEFEKNGVVYPEATGRSFEVRSLRDKSWNDKFRQSSLRNIIKTIYYNETGKLISMEELREKINNGEFKIAAPGIWFDNLEKQGVLFLNATLTVKPHQVDSHTKFWTSFMNELIIYISKVSSPVWLLWGNKAIERVSPLISDEFIIKASHPRVNAFCFENCFKETIGIDWTGMR